MIYSRAAVWSDSRLLVCKASPPKKRFGQFVKLMGLWSNCAGAKHSHVWYRGIFSGFDGGREGWFSIHILFASVVQTLLRNAGEGQQPTWQATRHRQTLWLGGSTSRGLQRAADAVLMVRAWHLLVGACPGRSHPAQGCTQVPPWPRATAPPRTSPGPQCSVSNGRSGKMTK